MQAIEALTQRTSAARLEAPAPDDRQLGILLQAAMRAADHGGLRPWRFLTITGEARDRLGELFCRAALADRPDLATTAQDKYRAMPHRAPMLLVVIGRVVEHPKVPAGEQLLSAGAAAQNIINAAYALGLGAMWRTGEMAYHPEVLRGLGLGENESLVGYIYLGTPVRPPSPPRVPETDKFLQSWS